VLENRHGHLDQALQEADREYHSLQKRNSNEAWRFRVLKAQLLFIQGKSKDALDLLNDDLPPALARTDVAARRKMVQGLAHGFLRQFDQAETELADAEALSRVLQPDIQVDVLQSRGVVDMNEGKYDQAGQYFHSVLEIARRSNLSYVESRALGNLANVAMHKERYDEAVDWYKTSLQLSEAAGEKGTSALTYGNMGWSYFAMGDLENAVAVTKLAEDLSAQAGLEGNRIYWLSNLGNYYYAEHNYSAAQTALQEALSRARKASDEATTTQSLNNLALISLDLGQADRAADYAKEALDLENAANDRDGALYSLDVEGSVEAANGHLQQAERIFLEVIHDPVAGASLRWEAQARLGEAYAAAGQRQKAERSFRQSIATVESVRSSVKTEEFRLSFLSSAISVYGDYISFLVREGRAEDALQIAELSRARALADGLGVSSATLSFPIRGFQPTKTARELNVTILSYWLGSQHSYTWAIDAGRVRLLQLPPAAEIDSLVESYRRALVGTREPLTTASADGEKLYDLLIASALPKISKGSRLIIIPDGSLYQLNFDALIAQNPAPHYFIDDAIIANANSLMVLAASGRTRAARGEKLLLVGDPVPASDEFPKLPQAQSEMKQIAAFFPDSSRTVYANASATAAAYLNSGPAQFSFIHFVAHGTASRTSPLDSAVILSRQGDSYKLYARDIIKQPLRAELVTISACHGAGERTYSGEGLVGLSWAFLHAGAHEVISALWEVDDNSTPQLMDRLYAELSKGTAPEAALRDAKLALLHSDSIYRKPFYWAPFQIYRGL